MRNWYVIVERDGKRDDEGPMSWQEAQKRRNELKKDNTVRRIGIEDESGMVLHEWIRSAQRPGARQEV